MGTTDQNDETMNDEAMNDETTKIREGEGDSDTELDMIQNGINLQTPNEPKQNITSEDMDGSDHSNSDLFHAQNGNTAQGPEDQNDDELHGNDGSEEMYDEEEVHDEALMPTTKGNEFYLETKRKINEGDHDGVGMGA